MKYRQHTLKLSGAFKSIITPLVKIVSQYMGHSLKMPKNSVCDNYLDYRNQINLEDFKFTISVFEVRNCNYYLIWHNDEEGSGTRDKVSLSCLVPKNIFFQFVTFCAITF